MVHFNSGSADGYFDCKFRGPEIHLGIPISVLGVKVRDGGIVDWIGKWLLPWFLYSSKMQNMPEQDCSQSEAGNTQLIFFF